MAASERRITRRFKLHVPIRIHDPRAPTGSEAEVKAVNISDQGVYFESNLGFIVGQLVEVLVMMPNRFTGKRGNECCFTGQVVHMQPLSTPAGFSGVGVHFLYFEPV
jgi:PilZ domain